MRPGPPSRLDSILIGVFYAVRRVWCGVVDHLWDFGEEVVGRPAWCVRCGWWGGFTVAEKPWDRETEIDLGRPGGHVRSLSVGVPVKWSRRSRSWD